MDINYLATQHLIQPRIHKKKPQILLVNQPIPNSPRVLSNVDPDPSGLGVHSAGQSQSAYPGLLITEISSRINICSNSGWYESGQECSTAQRENFSTSTSLDAET